MAKQVYPPPRPPPPITGAIPTQTFIGPFAPGILTGAHQLRPYANFGPQGHRRYGIKLKRPREPVPYRPPEWDA